MKNYLLSFACSFTTLILFIQCHHDSKIVSFNVDGRSSLLFFNDTDDSIKINFENWSIIPPKMHPVDTVVLPQKTIELDLLIQGLDYVPISIDGVKQYLFMQPDSKDSLVFQKSSRGSQIDYFGDSKEINEFIYKKAKFFNSAEADWIARAQATHSVDDFKQIISINDSINQLHKNYLNKNSANLPGWFIEFEDARLNYLNAGSKLSSLFYRKRDLDKEDEFAQGFFHNPKEYIDTNFPLLNGNVRYITYLNSYIEFVADPLLQDSMPTTNQEWRDYYQSRFDVIDNELTGSVKDVYSSFVLSRIIESRRHILDTAWIDKVTDERLNNSLRHQLTQTEVLPTGSRIPYFSLSDSTGTAYSPNDFLGKIVLINFWSTMCKPCIKEFPFENNLVEKFRNKPVQIINVCMESRKDHWIQLVKKHELKTLNLFSESKSDYVLSEKFDINGWPHSILIGADGRVIKNKCRKASDGVDELIDGLLEKLN